MCKISAEISPLICSHFSFSTVNWFLKTQRRYYLMHSLWNVSQCFNFMKKHRCGYKSEKSFNSKNDIKAQCLLVSNFCFCLKLVLKCTFDLWKAYIQATIFWWNHSFITLLEFFLKIEKNKDAGATIRTNLQFSWPLQCFVLSLKRWDVSKNGHYGAAVCSL